MENSSEKVTSELRSEERGLTSGLTAGGRHGPAGGLSVLKDTQQCGTSDLKTSLGPEGV